MALDASREPKHTLFCLKISFVVIYAFLCVPFSAIHSNDLLFHYYELSLFWNDHYQLGNMKLLISLYYNSLDSIAVSVLSLFWWNWNISIRSWDEGLVYNSLLAQGIVTLAKGFQCSCFHQWGALSADRGGFGNVVNRLRQTFIPASGRVVVRGRSSHSQAQRFKAW